MKSTGIVRRIDDLGRIVIPKELRKEFCLREGDPVEISVDDNGIYLTKYRPTEITEILDSFKGLEEYAFESGGSPKEQRVKNLRLLVEKELDEIFK